MNRLSDDTGGIAVMGVGGAGGNMLHALHQKKVSGVRYIAVDTDIQALQALGAKGISEAIQLSSRLLKGLSADADHHVGEEVATGESVDAINATLEGVSLLIFLCGLGGGTGSGISPMIARLAREKGIFTAVLATLPFVFEGKKRNAVAKNSLKALGAYTDWLALVDCDCIGMSDKRRTLTEILQRADEIMGEMAGALRSYCEDERVIPRILCPLFTRTLCESGVRLLRKEAVTLAVECVCHPDVPEVDLDAAFAELTVLLLEPGAFRLSTRRDASVEAYALRLHFTAQSYKWEKEEEKSHRPSGDDFVFDDEESEIPTLCRCGTGGGYYDSGVWFSTPLPPKDFLKSEQRRTESGKGKVLQFPGCARGKSADERTVQAPE